MQQEQAINKLISKGELSSSSPISLSGHLLTNVRSAWMLVALLSIGLFLVALPFRFRLHLATCIGIDCPNWQLSPAEVLTLQDLGFSTVHFATLEVMLAMILMLVYGIVAFIIYWRRSNEWIALLVGLWLITFGTSITQTSLTLPILQSLWGILNELGWVLLLPLFLLTFPDGRFIPRWVSCLSLTFSWQFWG
jgi:hypothetical protein